MPPVRLTKKSSSSSKTMAKDKFGKFGTVKHPAGAHVPKAPGGPRFKPR
jgi:hypothetical protein